MTIGVQKETLTSRERVERAFAHRDHDRVPRHESFWGETIARWQQEGLDGDGQTVLNLLGSDFHSLLWYWPVPFPGKEIRLEETAETFVMRDSNGGILRQWKHKSGTPEHIGFECDSRAIWEAKYRPAFAAQGLQLNIEDARRRLAEGRAVGRWCYLAGVEPFECTRKILGDVGFAMATLDDPEWVVDVSRTVTDALLRNYQAILDAGIRPDGLWTYGDMAFRSATFCSPTAYRELIWPDHKRLCEWAHAHGMRFIYHTDGDVNGVMDLYVEAGFDCLQPLESKAGMDIRKLCPRYGRDLAFFGNIDVMKMIPNDLALIEEEIASKFAAGKATRGYMYHSDHSVPPQVSWATYQAIIGMVERHGRYD